MNERIVVATEEFIQWNIEKNLRIAWMEYEIVAVRFDNMEVFASMSIARLLWRAIGPTLADIKFNVSMLKSNIKCHKFKLCESACE